jgi:hypothetical protein
MKMTVIPSGVRIFLAGGAEGQCEATYFMRAPEKSMRVDSRALSGRLSLACSG